MFQKALSAVLSDLCVYGTLVRHLYDFMEEASGARLSRSHGNTSGSVTSVCQTHQAFAAALSVYLQNMQQDLCRLERVVCAQGLFDISPIISVMRVLYIFNWVPNDVHLNIMATYIYKANLRNPCHLKNPTNTNTCTKRDNGLLYFPLSTCHVNI